MSKVIRRKNPRNVMIDDELWQRLAILIGLWGIGKPSVSSVICQAIQEFIERKLEEKPVLREQFEKRLSRPHLVPLLGKTRSR